MTESQILSDLTRAIECIRYQIAYIKSKDAKEPVHDIVNQKLHIYHAIFLLSRVIYFCAYRNNDGIPHLDDGEETEPFDLHYSFEAPPTDKPNNRKTASKREIYIRFYGKTEWVRYPSKAAFRLMYPDIHFQCPALEDEYKTIANEAETLFREFERIGNPIDAYRRWTSKRNPSGQYLATILNTARS